MATQSLEERLAKLEKRNEELEKLGHEIERLRNVNEIQNMMSTYEYLHTVNNHEAIVEMFAKNVPDVYINIGTRGHWVGNNAARRAFGTFIKISAGNPDFQSGRKAAPSVAWGGSLLRKAPTLVGVVYRHGTNSWHAAYPSHYDSGY